MNAKRLLTLAALMVLGAALSAKADDVLTYTNTQVYYVGTDSTYNPFQLTNSIGNPISILNMTPMGAPGTLTFNTSGNPGVSLVSNTPGLFNVQLFGNTSGIISGGQLVAGTTYTFNSSQDTFTINGYTNSGSDPIDGVTIDVAANGVVTLSSSSLELATDPVQVSSPTGVPEIDPTTGFSAFTLISGAVLIIRGRRKKYVI
jgi:hypothetical protein